MKQNTTAGHRVCDVPVEKRNKMCSHPASKGLVESMVGKLKQSIRKMIVDQPGDVHS